MASGKRQAGGGERLNTITVLFGTPRVQLKAFYLVVKGPTITNNLTEAATN